MHFDTYAVGDVVFAVHCEVPLEALQSPRVQAFRVYDRPPAVLHRYHVILPETLTLGDLEPAEVASLQHCTCFPKDGSSLVVRSPAVRDRLRACLAAPDAFGVELRPPAAVVYDFSTHRADVFCTPEYLIFHEMRIRRLFASSLPAFSAWMIHACAVVRNGVAAVFLATDAGGKTTVARLSGEGAVLNDDQIVVRKQDGEIWSHSTPWGQISSGPRRSRIGGYFLLEQGPDFNISRATRHDVLDYFCRESTYYNAYHPRFMRLRTFEILADAAKCAPAFRMRFSKDYVDWDAVDAAMAHAAGLRSVDSARPGV